MQQMKILEETNDKELELYNLKKKLKMQIENDPRKLDILVKQSIVHALNYIITIFIFNNLQKLKDSINRWTDNIFAVKSWCKKKFFTEEKVLNKQFGIPEDLDYLE